MDSSKVREYLLSYYENIQSGRTLGEYLPQHIFGFISITLISLLVGFVYAKVLGYQVYALIFYLLICFVVVVSLSTIIGIRCRVTDWRARPETMIKLRVIFTTFVVIYVIIGFAFIIYTGGSIGAITSDFTVYEQRRNIFIATALLAPLFAYISTMSTYHLYLINKYCPDLKDYNLKSDSKK